MFAHQIKHQPLPHSVPAWRKRFAHDQADGLYSGATLLLAYDAVSLPFSGVAAVLATAVVYPLTSPMPMQQQHQLNWLTVAQILAAIWSSAVLAEQMCIAFLLVCRRRHSAAIAVTYLLCVSLTLASGTVRSFRGIQPWLQENTKVTHTRYAALLLHAALFGEGVSGGANGEDAAVGGAAVTAAEDWVTERMGRTYGADHLDVAIAVAFVCGLALVNMLLYLVPMPKHVERKFVD